MAAYYKISDIALGPPSFSSGHEAYLKARYKPKNQQIIYKKNKHGNPAFSRLEVSFSQLALLFLRAGLTSPQSLVRDDQGEVVGVAVEHLSYVIAQKESLNQRFYILNDPSSTCEATLHPVAAPSQIPIYFLDKLPQGFYARLLIEEKKQNLTIDYESLASILATSYTLEEDDLHKGNFGFYLIEKEGKPHVVFFKIDHDLMFVDSIMGFQTRRPYHLLHGPRAFNIYADDLLTFPNLKYSSNSYWPTKFGYVSNPLDNKEYHSRAENAAFACLAQTPGFIKGKWKAFYKHILTPQVLIEKTLADCVDINNPVDRAHNALITHALIARLAHLRATLFSIKEFRDFVMGLNDAENEALLHEIVPQDDPLAPEIRKSLMQYKEKCHAAIHGFDEGDTPLHIMIKLGEYRYEETIRMFGHFINTPNSKGKTPLDIAQELSASQPADEVDIGKNRYYTMKHLLEHGAQKTPAFEASKIERQLLNYKFLNPYLAKITAQTSYAEFKDILRDLGEDHRFCLKYQKNLAIECINQWVQLKENKPGFAKELAQLRKDVNGKTSADECAGIKYLRQLRSKLWIIRQLRGLYGRTTTQMEINTLITQAETRIASKEPGCWTFFGGTVPKQAAPSIDLGFFKTSLSL